MIMRPVALLLVLTSVLSAAPDPAAFSSRLLQIYQQADVDAFLSLVEVDEATPQEIRAQLRENFIYNARKKATTAKIEELSGDEIISYEKDGETFTATLKPVARLVVTFDDHEERPKLTAFSHLIGLKDGHYRIVTAKKQPRTNKAPMPAR